MKFLSFRRRLFLQRRAAKLQRRKIVWKMRRKQGRINHDFNEMVSINKILPFKSRRKIFHAKIPEILSLSENYDEVIDFFSEFRRITYKSDRKIYVDFRKIRKVGPRATLMLAAEIDRFRRIFKFPLFAVDYNLMNSEVRRLFTEMGLYEMLNARMPKINRSARSSHFDQSEGTARSLVFIRFTSANLTDGSLANRIGNAMSQIAGQLPKKLWARIYGALTEAMNNAIAHAYSEPRDSDSYDAIPIMNQWWMAGSFNTETRLASLQFFDQGVTIPRTLPREGMRERLTSLLGGLVVDGLDDAHMIQAATLVGRTSTKKSERGRGLYEMKKLVELMDDGQMRILSRHGEYELRAGNREKMRMNSRPMCGTLIEWQARIPSLET